MSISIMDKAVFSIDGNRIKIPGITKPGIKMRGLNKNIGIGKPVGFTIKKDVDEWFISIVYETKDIVLPAKIGNVGIDRGVNIPIADSDGNIVESPRFLKTSADKLRRRQRALSRAQKGSHNRSKAKTKVAQIHRKIRRQRDAFTHLISKQYSDKYQNIFIEDLKIKNMTARAHDKGVAAKSGLNKSILDVGWYAFETKLAYKLAEHGGTLTKVDPKYTSQTCSNCGHCEADNRKTQVEFKCLKCGFEINADINAAKNILAKGLQGLK